MSIQFLTLKWSLRPIVGGRMGSVYAVLGTLLLPWSGVWLLRANSAQLSVIFFYISVGFAIRAVLNRSRVNYALSAVACLFSLLQYQALALIIVLFPFITSALMGGATHSGPRRFYTAPWLGFTAYITYLVSLNATGDGDTTSAYEGQLANGVSPAVILANVGTLFRTSFSTWAYAWVVLCVAFAAISEMLHTTGWLSRATFRPPLTGLLQWSSAALVVAGLPLLALPYASGDHVRDPERILLPVAVGLFLVLLVLRLERLTQLRAPFAQTTLVIACLAVALGGLFPYWERAGLQTRVLHALEASLEGASEKKVLLKDFTGELGDFYTFLPPHLTLALQSEGLNVPVEICTPPGVDRNHPWADHVLGPTLDQTPTCPSAAEGLVLEWHKSAEGGALLR